MPEASIRLISINIERSQHIDLVLPFLREQKPDVVCAQELMEYDIPRFESELGMRHRFALELHHRAEDNSSGEGVGIFSSLPIVQSSMPYYAEGPKGAVDYDPTNAETKRKTAALAVLFCDIEKSGETFRIATTHFTWTPDGKPDDFQRQDMKAMLEILGTSGEFVLCGDFNAPRGGEIFAMLASRYKDNIPVQYTSSIDKNLHRAGDLQLMVDGLFSTPGYSVSDVALHAGVSDHMAIIARIANS